MVVVVAAHRLRRARPAAHPGPVREARGRPEALRRPVDAPAAQGEHLAASSRRSSPRRSCSSRRRSRAGSRCLGAVQRRDPRRAPGIYNVALRRPHHLLRYFYTAVTFNPVDVADNLKKYGGYIPGIRPGQEDGRVHRPRALAHHLRRRHLPRRRLRAADRHHERVQRAVLLRRHLAPHRRRRRARHGPADRGAPHHPPLRGLHRPARARASAAAASRPARSPARDAEGLARRGPSRLRRYGP